VIAVILVYEFTIGKQISKYSNQINTFTSKEGRKESVNKIREEINKGIKKERYLSKDDAKLINTFLNKIKKELEEASQH
jgi:polyribonucleotide nucleotidyltransferase